MTDDLLIYDLRVLSKGIPMSSLCPDVIATDIKRVLGRRTSLILIVGDTLGNRLEFGRKHFSKLIKNLGTQSYYYFGKPDSNEGYGYTINLKPSRSFSEVEADRT